MIRCSCERNVRLAGALRPPSDVPRAAASVAQVALALHELGVTALKRHDLPEAERLLGRSLAIKRALRARGAATEAAAEEASTLHNIAVCATHSRPPRLEEAEQLLRQALGLERRLAQQAGGHGEAALAATLIQLGRVAFRRGDLGPAEAHLQEALRLQRGAYSSDLHVNVAAVHHQLGVVLSARGRADEAAGHLREALRIREHLYGHEQSGASFEVAATLEIGRAHV